MKPVKACPCHSGAAYKDCCKPRHDATKPPETPEALMRSRYAAFALGLGGYLVDTLTSDHEDRAQPTDEHARELSRVKDTLKFLGLRVLSATTEGDAGEVLFFARVFEKGKNVSFAERSRFRREGGLWRYASGELIDPATLDLR